MGEFDDALKEFLIESHEGLDFIDHGLVAEEAEPGGAETVGRVFRVVHSIKGTCGFLGLPRLEEVAHAGENLLCVLRDKLVAWRPEITDILLELSDAMRRIMRNVEASGEEGTTDYSSLIKRLGALANPPAAAVQEMPTAILQDIPVAVVREVPTEPVQEEKSEAITAESCQSNSDANLSGSPAASDDIGSGAAAGTIRVEIGVLDKLMNLVGELVLARNQILQHSSSRADTALLGASQRLNLITTELQEGVMKSRMQPIGKLWDKLPRVVRDLAKSCGKQVRLEMQGRETELDRTILEAIKDPLTHLIRNSVDHGIEPSERRTALGKPAIGCLRLMAFHESGQVNIEISDDGAGIDREHVSQKALALGLISREQLARMSEREVLDLVFHPGLSTAEKVTTISGRGVGMDVVRTNIERIGGTVDIQSWPGVGTTFRVRIPLTLAIIPALTITCRRDRYAIPQVNLLELVRLEGKEAERGIERVHGAPIFRLRGSLLPLVDLGGALQLEASSEGNEHGTNIVVLQADGRRFGLVVDGIDDTEEIVVKPLGKLLKGITLFAGATIMGDGRVALILDVSAIARQANITAALQARLARQEASETNEVAQENRRSYLLFRQGDTRRMAVPLDQVARLEEIASSSVERSSEGEVVQYRGRVLPLLRLENAHRGCDIASHARDPMHVVVYAGRGRSVGLVVDEILDVVEDAPELNRSSAGSGLIGSAVIQKRVTDLIDLTRLIEANVPDAFLEPVGAN